MSPCDSNSASASSTSLCEGEAAGFNSLLHSEAAAGNLFSPRKDGEVKRSKGKIILLSTRLQVLASRERDEPGESRRFISAMRTPPTLMKRILLPSLCKDTPLFPVSLA